MNLPSSSIKAWWKCQRFGHEWQFVPHIRNKGHGCPNCYRNRRRKLINKYAT
ncbi:MAG: zinc-ribbon domain-containing protein [Clostridia bacterium]|nr:zinc-ribbon domain-containing protein [Clostridia bacterium]